MKAFENYYRLETVFRLQKQNHRLVLGLAVSGGAALIGFVLLCVGVNPLNAQRRMAACFALWCLWGWPALFLLRFRYARRRRDLRHVEWVCGEARERLEGELRLEPGELRLRGSVPVRRLTLQTEARERRLKVHADLARALEAAEGRPVTLTLAGGFVADCEVRDAED